MAASSGIPMSNIDDDEDVKVADSPSAPEQFLDPCDLITYPWMGLTINPNTARHSPKAK